MKRFCLSICGLLLSTVAWAQLSLDECQRLAQQNYPLIGQYGLIERSTDYSVSNARRAYIPQINLSAQATYQSAVSDFPASMQSMFQQMGIKMHGLNKDQYKVAAEVSQLIWDGGQSRSQRRDAEAEGRVSKAGTDVDMYAVRGRINSLYFGILLLGAQAEQNDQLTALLNSNLQKLNALLRNGVATQSDVDAVQVEILSASQQRIQIESSKEAYTRMLSLFVGRDVSGEELTMPSVPSVVSLDVQRPELSLFEAQMSQLDAKRSAVAASTNPRFSAFFQGLYGNPGLNPFEAMIENKWSLNYIAGVKFQWNIGSYYTRRNSMRKIATAKEQIANQREVFLFNTSLQTTEQSAAIEKMRRVMADDDRIIELRESIRRAAEARLTNGVIDVNDLLRDVTSEHQALTQRVAHQIELLKDIYDLKNMTNN